MAVLVGVNGPQDFITKQACWCRGGGALFWTFVATIGTILTVCSVQKQFLNNLFRMVVISRFAESF